MKTSIICRHCQSAVGITQVDAHHKECAALNHKLLLIAQEFNERERIALAIAETGMRGYAA